MNKHFRSFLFPRFVFQNVEGHANEIPQTGSMSTPESAELEEQVADLEQRLADLKKIDRSFADPLIAELDALKQKIASGRSLVIDEARGQLGVLTNLVEENEYVADKLLEEAHIRNIPGRLDQLLVRQVINESEYIRLFNERNFIQKNIKSENSKIKADASARLKQLDSYIDGIEMKMRSLSLSIYDMNFFEKMFAGGGGCAYSLDEAKKNKSTDPEYERLNTEYSSLREIDWLEIEDPQVRAQFIARCVKFDTDLNRLMGI